MRFWDSSAIVPMLMEESYSVEVRRTYGDDPDIVVWWGTEVECVSAITRQERNGALRPNQVEPALHNLEELARSWQEVQAVEAVRRDAVRMLRVHDLRAPDATQLAAARIASESRPDTLEFVTLDRRLAAAALKEGFPLVFPA